MGEQGRVASLVFLALSKPPPFLRFLLPSEVAVPGLQVWESPGGESEGSGNPSLGLGGGMCTGTSGVAKYLVPRAEGAGPVEGKEGREGESSSGAQASLIHPLVL